MKRAWLAVIVMMAAMAMCQRGFSDHRIRDWEDYRQHREYIYLNPARAGLCGDANKYPYCSYCGGLDAVPQRLKPPELNAVRHG